MRKWVNKIENIAMENILLLTTGNFNHDNLYEIENRTHYSHNIHVYKHHYNDMLKPVSYATFYQSAEFA